MTGGQLSFILADSKKELTDIKIINFTMNGRIFLDFDLIESFEFNTDEENPENSNEILKIVYINGKIEYWDMADINGIVF
jgi:hypothetical protein